MYILKKKKNILVLCGICMKSVVNESQGVEKPMYDLGKNVIFSGVQAIFHR